MCNFLKVEIRSDSDAGCFSRVKSRSGFSLTVGSGSSIISQFESGFGWFPPGSATLRREGHWLGHTPTHTVLIDRDNPLGLLFFLMISLSLSLSLNLSVPFFNLYFSHSLYLLLPSKSLFPLSLSLSVSVIYCFSLPSLCVFSFSLFLCYRSLFWCLPFYLPYSLSWFFSLNLCVH